MPFCEDFESGFKNDFSKPCFLEVRALTNQFVGGPRAEKTHLWEVRVLKKIFPADTYFLDPAVDSLDVLDSTDSITSKNSFFHKSVFTMGPHELAF